MTTHREPDKEDDQADAASLEDIDETCSYCGVALGGVEGCSTPGCEGNPETDDEDWDEEVDDEEIDNELPIFPEGALGEGDKDA